MSDITRILIVDDHNLIAEAWSKILNAQENLKVIDTTGSEEEAFLITKGYRPDIVLMDINLKDGNGFSCTERILDTMPKTKVIGLSIHDDLAMVKKMFKSGAKGYLTKNSSTKELIDAIKEVSLDKKYICREIKEKYFDQMMSDEGGVKELTEREIEIVRLIGDGLSSKEIGLRIEVSHRTVDTHRYNILKKLNINSSAQLIIWAKNKGYL